MKDGGNCVLVADDNPQIRQILELLLSYEILVLIGISALVIGAVNALQI